MSTEIMISIVILVVILLLLVTWQLIIQKKTFDANNVPAIRCWNDWLCPDASGNSVVSTQMLNLQGKPALTDPSRGTGILYTSTDDGSKGVPGRCNPNNPVYNTTGSFDPKAFVNGIPGIPGCGCAITPSGSNSDNRDVKYNELLGTGGTNTPSVGSWNNSMSKNLNEQDTPNASLAVCKTMLS